MYDFLKNPQFEHYNIKLAVLGKGIFSEDAIKIKNDLINFGFEAEFFEKYEDIFNYHPNCVIVTCPIYYPYKKFKDRSITWVAINGEQLPSQKIGCGLLLQKRLKEVKKYCKYFDILLDYNSSNIETIKTFYNGRVELLRKNRFSANTNIPEFIPDKGKLYDILFYGNTRNFKRRQIITNFLAEHYKMYPATEGLWGEDLVEAIKQSKICLNIHAEETRYFEGMRFVKMFANHAFVMSDKVYDSRNFIDGEDYVSFFLTEICSKIDYYLEHEEERKRIADNAYLKIKESENETDKFTATILDCIIIERTRKCLFENPPLYKRVMRCVRTLFAQKKKNET